MENTTSNHTDIDYENLLKDSYSIDDESFHDGSSSSRSSVPSLKKVAQSSSKEVAFMNFIQSIKDDNLSHLDTHYLNKISGEGYTSVQYAALYGSAKALPELLAEGADENVKIDGMPLIHLSLTLGMFYEHREKSIECYRYLKENYPQMVGCKDRLGRIPMHVIVFFDIEEAIEMSDVNEDTLLNEDNNGDSVMDYCAKYNSKKCFEKILNFYSPKSFALFIIEKDKKFIEKCLIYNSTQILIDLLMNIILKEEVTKMLEQFKNIINTYMIYENSYLIKNAKNALTYLESKLTSHELELKSIQFSQSTKTTSIVYNPNCISHLCLPEEPVRRIQKRNELYENSDRQRVLVQPPFGILLSDIFVSNSNFQFVSTTRRAALSDILKVHDIDYITSIKYKCDNIKNEDEFLLIDSDTYLSMKTFDNIYNTAGCVLEAVDQVMTKKATNAFAVVRPPGHHVGYFGAVDNEENLPKSNGFCVVNNVCIAAAYCKYKYQSAIKKIAIIDFDVHHGNGTEEIVTMLDKKTFTASSTNNTLCQFSLSKNVSRPWLDLDDANNVLFISLHHYNEDNPKSFYPYTGSTATNTKKSSPLYPGGILNIPFTTSLKHPYDYRDAIRSKVIPRLAKFAPDIIFISAGFDGHELETINDGSMLLQEYDFAYITEEIQKVANKYCEGRVVSVLEGGYNVRSGIVSSFSQSVMTHARFLNMAVNKEVIGGIVMPKIKRKEEYEKEVEMWKRIKRFENHPRRSERIKHIEEEKKHVKKESNANDEMKDIVELNEILQNKIK